MIKSSAWNDPATVVGGVLGKGVSGATTFILKHPLVTLGAVGGTALIHRILAEANRGRGMHQLINEYGKRKQMSRQEDLMRRIYNIQASQAQQDQAIRNAPKPVIPPLR